MLRKCMVLVAFAVIGALLTSVLASPILGQVRRDRRHWFPRAPQGNSGSPGKDEPTPQETGARQERDREHHHGDGPSGLATDQRARAHAPSGRDAGDETWEEEPRRLLYRGGIQLGILECYLSSQRFRISSLASCDMPIAAPSNVEASSTFSGCGVLHFVGSKRFLQKATIRLATRDDSTKANSPQYSSQNRACVFSSS